MIIADVMDEVGERLEEIYGLRTLPFAAGRVASLPAALISLPPSGTYDLTYGRGLDSFRLEIFVLVSKNVDLAARNALSPFISGSGSSSVKQVLSSGNWNSCDRVQVVSFTSARVTLSESKYLAAVFESDVYGRGAA